MKDRFFDLVLRSLAGFKSFLFKISGKFGVQMPQPEYGVPQPMYGVPAEDPTFLGRLSNLFERWGLLVIFIPVSIIVVIILGIVALIWKSKSKK